jgi:hypothetical protein
MTMDDTVVKAVWERAGRRCEYCHLPARYSEAPFQIDHIIARKHHGTDELSNLALACYFCNRYKGPNIAGIDPLSGQITRLFHPRHDDWPDHFAWNGPTINGLTAIGRTTADVLWINHPVMAEIRRWLIADGRIP